MIEKGSFLFLFVKRHIEHYGVDRNKVAKSHKKVLSFLILLTKSYQRHIEFLYEIYFPAQKEHFKW